MSDKLLVNSETVLAFPDANELRKKVEEGERPDYVYEMTQKHFEGLEKFKKELRNMGRGASIVVLVDIKEETFFYVDNRDPVLTVFSTADLWDTFRDVLEKARFIVRQIPIHKPKFRDMSGAWIVSLY